jgi:hypothetical protein
MKTEKTLAVIIILAILLKWLHIPFMNIVLIQSLSLLTFIYLFGSFYFLCDKDISRQNMVLSIVWGLCLGVIPMGILFKLCWWPGSGAILIVGVYSALFFLILIYFLKKKAPEELSTYYKNLTARTIALFTIALIFYLTPTLEIIKIFTHNDLEYQRLYLQTQSAPRNGEYRHQLEMYVEHRDSLRAFGKR